MKHTREEIKKRIEEFEYYINGFQRLNGRDVQKDKAVADLIIHDFDDGITERYDNCEYPYVKIFAGKYNVLG